MRQIKFKQLSTNNNNANNAAWVAFFGAATGTENGARSWVPLETHIGRGAAVVTTAPTGIQSYSYLWRVGGLVNGNTLSLGAGVVRVAGDHAAVMPASTVVADLGLSSSKRHLANTVKNNTPPNQATRYTIAYEVPDEDGLAWHQAGNGSDNITIASANDRFLTWDWVDNVGVTTTESVSQIPWPLTGVFKYFIIIPGITSLDTADFALRIAGADAKVFNVVGGTNQIDIVSEVPITAGQLVNWRFRRTGGSGTSCSPLLLAGFIATGL